MDIVVMVVLGISIACVLLVGSVIYLYFFRLWFRTHIAQCSVPLLTIFKMFFRGGNPQVVIGAYIIAHKAGAQLSLEELEAQYKKKVNVKAVVLALIEADKQGESVTFETLCQQELKTI